MRREEMSLACGLIFTNDPFHQKNRNGQDQVKN